MTQRAYTKWSKLFRVPLMMPENFHYANHQQTIVKLPGSWTVTMQ